MPAAVAAAIEYIAAAIGTEMVLTAGEIYLASQAIVATAAVYTLRENQRRQQNAARDSYNASLRDRYVMTRGATEPRQVVLGRQRVSGPMAYIGSYGTNREHLVFALILAAHEVDAVEHIYFDDERVTLDGSGNVLAVNRRDLFTLTGTSATFTLSSEPAAGTVSATVAYGTTQVSLGVSVSGSSVTVTGGTAGSTGTVTIAYQPAQSPWTRTEEYTDDQAVITLNSSGNGSVTLPHTPDPGTVRVVYAVGSGESQSDYDLTPYASVSGSVLTVTGSPVVGVSAYVSYRWNASSSKARVRKYLGSAGQAADAGMIAALPGVWTSAHTLTGLAYLVVELDYDPDAFPSGLPNVSAQVRGAKLYDPRTGTTAWSENPALMMRYVATSPLLGRQSAATVNDASVITAANVCDTASNYVVNGRTYSRALYTAGLAVKSGTRAKDILDDLARAMAGRWVFVDGQLRVKAGSYVTPLQTLDESWLVGSQAVQVQARANRSDVFNVATGKFADETRDYLVGDYPRVAAASYITEDGAELPLDLQFNAVTFTGQAQQVAAVAMRDARQGLRVSLLCNMRAFPVEVFDTLYVTLPRFGWSAKAFEVLDVSWTLDGGIQLSLKETDPSIWALGTSFADTDPAPNTLFPSPWRVPPITGLTCASGTSQLLKQSDGTIVSRIEVGWNAITDAFVTDGGGVEVRYGFAWQTEDEWQSVEAPGGQSVVFLTESIRDGLIYLVKARAFNSLVKGAWCKPVLHEVVGKSSPPANVGSFGYIVTEAGVEFSWTPATDADYASTVLKSGAAWASGTRLFDGAANKWTWVRPASGTYTVLAKHKDTSGNESAAAASITFTYTSAGISNADVSLTPSGTLVGGGGGSISLGSIAGSIIASQLPAIVDATKFASGVEPVTVVTGSTVPTTKSTNTIYLTGTGKLYRWSGTAYTASVPTTDLSGTVGSSQITDGAVVAAKIADATLTTAKFASGIEPLTIVTGALPTTKSTNTIFRTDDSKTYRWNGTAYVATVPTSDLTGTVTDAQIAGLAASKVTGQLSDSQIAAVGTAKLTGQVVASQIADASISTAKFASGIEPITVVASVPGTKSTNSIFNTTDGKLYRWSGSAYVATVPAGDISGTLAAAQIASVAASQITGQLSDTQLAAIGAAKVTGQITGTQITDGAISTAKLAAGSVTAAVIASDTITAAQIAANAITSSELAAGAVVAGKIAAGSIQAGDIAAGTITGDRLAANTITASQIASNTITAGQIAAGAIGASQIAAGAITTEKLLVTGRGTAINDDPMFTDPSAWTLASGVVFAAGTSASGAVANTYIGTASGTDRINYSVKTFAIGPGKRYRLSANLYASTGSTRNMYLLVQFYDQNGAYVDSTVTGWGGTMSGYTYGGAPPTDVWTRQGGQFGSGTGRPIPTNVRSCQIGVWFQYSGGPGSSQVYQACQDLRLEEVVEADLIVDGAVVASKIAAGAVTTAKLDAGAVTADKVAANSISAAAIQSGAITTAKLAAGAVTANEIAAGTITAAKIASGTITAAQIATDTITAGQIATGAIGASEIAAKAVTAEKLVIAGNGASLWADTCFQDSSAWVVANWHGLPIQATITDGIAGGTSLRSPTGTGASARGAKRVPVTVGKTYRISLYARRSSDANGTLYFRIDGSTSESGAYEERGYWIEGQVPATTWTRYTASVVAAQPFWSPMVLVNYSASAGWMEAQDIRIEEVIPGELIVDGAITATKVAAGAITTAKLAAGAVTANELSANSVVAGKIATGAVNAAQIAAGAITTDKLLVTGRGAALNEDPGCQDPTAWQNGGHGDTASQVSLSDGIAGSYAFRSTTGTGSSIDTAKLYPVSSGKRYRLSVWVRRSSTANGVLYLRLVDQIGNQLTQFYEGATPTTSWVRLASEFVPTAAQTSVRIRLILNWTGSAGYHEATDIRLEEKAEGDLIVDGTIAASKIAAGTLTADKMVSGLLSADNVLTRGLTVRDNSGNVLFGVGTNLDWGRISNQPSGIYNSSITISGGAIQGIGSGAGTAVANANISIGSNGALSGAGGGQVTIGGLGYSGELNATYGAVAGANLRDSNGRTVSDVRLLGNLLDSTAWAPDTTGSQTGFPENGTSSGGLNYIAYDSLPDGSRGILWRARSGSAAGSSSEGGWNSTSFNVVASKMYRFSVWIRCFGANASGSFYLGVGGGTVSDIGGGINYNPYFLANGRSLLPDSQWVLVVGYVYPSSYGGTQYNRGGVYRGSDGVKILDGTDFKWVAGTTSSYHRTYQYYTNQANNYQDFWNPRVDLVDGTEPSLDSLLAGGKAYAASLTATWGGVSSRPSNLASLSGGEAIQNSQITISGGAIQGIGSGAGTAVANANISIGSNGALSGAGGGQVTLGGIGFSGDTDAQRNSRITVDGSGLLQGIGSGAGTAVANSVLPSGVNLQYNSDFTNGLDGWTNAGGYGIGGQTEGGINLNTSWYLAPYSGPGTGVLWSRQAGRAGSDGYYYEIEGRACTVVGGKRYAISAYTGAHRCKVAVFAYVYDASNNAIANTYVGNVENNEEASGGSNLTGYKRTVGVATLPSNAAYVKVRLRKYDTKSGYSDSYMFIGRVQVEQVADAANDAGAWSPMGYLADDSIGIAKFGTDIQTTNYAANSAGWRITKAGQAFFNDISVRGRIAGGAFTAYAWPGYGQGGFYLGPEGLLLGNANGNTVGVGQYFQIDAGTGNVYSPQFTIINGSASFSGTLSAAIVNTDQIVGNAASTPYTTTSAGASASITVVVPNNASALLIQYYLGPDTYTYTGGGGKGDPGGYVQGPVLTGLTYDGSTTNVIVVGPTAGSHTVTVTRSYYTGTMRLSVLVLKR